MSDSLWRCYWRVWKKTFVYEGRAPRREFWTFFLANLFLWMVVVFAGLYWFISQYGYSLDAIARWALYVYVPLNVLSLILLFPSVAVGIRRMHDIGHSGWWFGGIVLTNWLVIPVITTFIDDELFRVAGSFLTLILLIVLICLCCFPSKVTEQPHSSVIMQ